MDLDNEELEATRKLNGLNKKDDININWEQMYLDEVDKCTDVVLLYNGLLNKIKDKIEELDKEYNRIHAQHYRDCGILEEKCKAKKQVLEELLQKEDK